MSRMMFGSKFFWKIYTAFSLLFLCMMLLTSWVAYFRVQETIKENVRENLRDKIKFLLPHAEQILIHPSEATERLIHSLGESTASRISIIDAQGKLVFDTDLDGEPPVDHLERPEVQLALSQPFGMKERHSATTRKPMFYLAKAVRQNDELLGFLRVALSMDRIDRDLAAMQATIALVVVGGVFLAMALGWQLAKRVTVPIREMVVVAEALRSGHYERKVRFIARDELGELGDTLNRLGRELTNKIAELQRLEKVRRDFVANVSHEIKTPLTSICGYVETLLAGAIDEPGVNRRFLEKIQRNCQRLGEIVQDILSLAKIESGADLYKLTPIEWNAIVQQVAARHEDAIHQKHLTVKLDEAPTALTVLGDREAMTQVIDNLLTNAVKYTAQGGTITVRLRVKGTWGKLEVEDNGIGIPAEHLGRIFERFYRVDKARSRDLGGTGLGLSIVKHLVSGMGGEISVESQPGSGSCFKVLLRLAKDAPAAVG